PQLFASNRMAALVLVQTTRSTISSSWKDLLLSRVSNPVSLIWRKFSLARHIHRGIPMAMVLLAALFLTGCPSKNGAGGKNILRYALQSPPTRLDPAEVEDGDTIDMLQQVFESLVMWNDKNEVVPNIAEKWDISPDGTVYTFKLRDNVKFHNG